MNQARLVMNMIDALWDETGYMGGNHTGEGPDPYPLFVLDTLDKMARMCDEEFFDLKKKVALLPSQNEEEVVDFSKPLGDELDPSYDYDAHKGDE